MARLRDELPYPTPWKQPETAEEAEEILSVRLLRLELLRKDLAAKVSLYEMHAIGHDRAEAARLEIRDIDIEVRALSIAREILRPRSAPKATKPKPTAAKDDPLDWAVASRL